ncbi:MAG TPA: 50S ribosomal protein L24 [Candidatus Saccharimonadales bacterium]|nr:50S ribosomal protein L24 [Candidatus Saccharimonadales bacterium]
MAGRLKNSSRMLTKIRLKKGDIVVVRAGKYKGKTGKITAVHPYENKVTVEGINIAKKHVKPSPAYPQGGIIELTKPIWVSKVGILEPTSKKPSRIGYKVTKEGTKTRVFKRTDKEIK